MLKVGDSLVMDVDSLVIEGVYVCGGKIHFIVSVPERSKGVDSSSTVFALVGSNPTADSLLHFLAFSLLPCVAFLREIHSSHVCAICLPFFFLA